VAKQIVRKNKDVMGSGCVKDSNGKIVVEAEKLMEAWDKDNLKNKVLNCLIML